MNIDLSEQHLQGAYFILHQMLLLQKEALAVAGHKKFIIYLLVQKEALTLAGTISSKINGTPKVFTCPFQSYIRF